MTNTTDSVARQVVGMTEADARRHVEARQLIWRVIARDGVSLPHRTNLRFDRVSVGIEEGIVATAEIR